MNSFLSHLHRDLRNARLTRRGAGDPSIVQKDHKEYPRMQQYVLPEPVALTASLEEVLSKRRSAPGGLDNSPLTLRDVGPLFGHALRRRKSSVRRPYPSGGARFSIETYLVAMNLVDVGSGAFHYDPARHVLERLWDIPDDIEFDKLIMHGTPKDFDFSALLIFTSVWERISSKYGDFGYILSLLEAGHMSQNILLVATALDLAARPMGGFDDAKIASILDLDESEQVVHAITLGNLRDKHDSETREDVYE